MSTPERAFGLELESFTPILGCEDGAGPAPGRATIVPAGEEAFAAWPSDRAERLHDVVEDDGTVLATIDAHPEAGYRFAAPGFGRFLVSVDASVVRCDTLGSATWEWQLYLTSQVLPLAAVVQGLEVFHAGAVSLDGRTLAFAGPSGAGKTTLTLALALQGAGFVADDALALSVEGDAVVAHPGPGLVNLRPGTAARLPADALGPVVGRRPDSDRTAIARDPTPHPLGALYYLDPDPAASEVRIEPIEPVDPRLLLLSTFVPALEMPARLAMQLDLCARIAATVPVYRLRAPEGPGPMGAAAAVVAHRRG